MKQLLRLFYSVCFSVISIFSLASSAYAHDSIYVVTSRMHLSTLERQDVVDLFQGNKRKLDGKTVEILNQAFSRPIREQFYRSLYGKSDAQMDAQWDELVFSGKVRSPATVDDDESVIKYIKSRPDSIGYVSTKTSLSPDIVVVFEIK